VRLEKIPLTPNGKIDRRVLPKPELKISESYIAPGNEIEKKLVEMWSGVLGIEKEKIGINDNFFHLGGHSLKATILVSRIHKELKANVPLPEIFKTSHIRGLAAFIKNAETQRFFSIEAVEKKEYHILSSAQRRLLVLHKMNESGIAYNMPSAHIINCKLDEEAFTRAFAGVVERQESLRTIFITVNGEPKQKILKPQEIGFKVEKIDLRKKLHVNKEERLNALVGEEAKREFNLNQGPLVIARLIRLENEKYLLLLNMHHIISDGWSMEVLVREIGLLYDININGGENSLPPLRIQYKDFSLLQNKRLNGGEIKQQKGYWLKEFSGEIPVVNLPTDYTRPGEYSIEGNTVDFILGKEEVYGLKALGARENATLYIVLFAVLNVLMAKLSGNEDIVLGCPKAGRWHTGLHELIGMFVNTLAIRCFPGRQKSFREFLNQVRDKILNAFENQEYQFEDLVNDLAVDRDLGRHPLFDVLFALQNYNKEGSENLLEKTMDSKLNGFRYEHRIAKFDIMIVCIETGNNLSFIFSYRTKLYKKETIERFTRYFQEIVQAILEDPDKKIASIEIVSKERQNKLIEKLKEEKGESNGNVEKNQKKPEILEADFEY
jgi:acyl carrier protein